MSNGNLPEVPQSWRDTLDKVKSIALIVASITATVSAPIAAGISGCNNGKLANVEQKQVINSAHIEEIKSATQEHTDKLDSVRVKVDALKP